METRLAPAQIEELVSRAWEIASAHAAACPPLDLLSRLVDGPPHSTSPAHRLEHQANLRLLADDTTRTLIRGARAILRVLAHTTQAELVEGRVPAGYVDWPTTLRQRAAPGGEFATVVLSRSDVNRDLPETRLLKFLLREIHRRAGAALAAHDSGRWRPSIEVLAAQAGRLATHSLLQPVPAMSTRQGHVHAKTSGIFGYRAVARAYEFHQAMFGSGDRSLLLDLFRGCISTPESEERAFAMLVLFRVKAWLEAHGARRVSVHLREPGQGMTFVFAAGAQQWDVHFQHVPPHLIAGGADHSLAAAAASMSAPDLALPEVAVHVSSGGSSERTLLLATQTSSAPEAVRQRLLHLDRHLMLLRGGGDPHTSLLLVTGGPLARFQNWARALDPSPSGQVTDLDSLDACLRLRNLA